MVKYLILILLLSSCSAGYHLKRAKRHLLIAESKGANIKQDTVFKDIKLSVPGIKVQFEPKIITMKDTVYWETIIPGAEKPAKLKIIYLKDTTGNITAQPSLELPDKKVEAKLPITVNQKITAKKGIGWEWLLICYIAGIVTWMLQPLIRKLIIHV
jgi:hypothetical protein